MTTPETGAFERTTRSFRVHTRDGSLWVEDINGGQDDAWLLVPLGELDALIKALHDARVALAPSSTEDTPAGPNVAFLRRYATALARDMDGTPTRDQVMVYADAYAEGWHISEAEADLVVAILSEVASPGTTGTPA